MPNDRILKIRIDGRLIDQVNTYATTHSIDGSKAVRTLLRAGLDQAALADTVRAALAKALPAAVDAAVDRRMSGLRRAIVVSAALAAAQGAGATAQEAQAIAKQLADALQDER